jgi:hypothetical protein
LELIDAVESEIDTLSIPDHCQFV